MNPSADHPQRPESLSEKVVAGVPPAVEAGLWPSGKNRARGENTPVAGAVTLSPPGGTRRLYVSQDGRRHHFQTCSKNSGFTLIELFVVVATLALLSTMLLPVLAGTKSQSRIASCAANFRQWAVSANLYANDYQDRLPSFNCYGGGKYGWDVGTGMCNALYPYGMDVPVWFCPFRPAEWDAKNKWALTAYGNPIQNIAELSAYFSVNYPNELELNHNYWVPRNGDNPPDAAGIFPKDWSTVPPVLFPAWAKGASSTVYGWPVKLHDIAAAHVPFVSDKCYSGQGSGLSGSAMSTNVNTIAANSAHFVNGILIGVNAAYADGHVESHNKNKIVPAYASGTAYWFY